MSVYTVYIDTCSLTPKSNSVQGASEETIWRLIFYPIRWLYELLRPVSEDVPLARQLDTVVHLLEAARVGKYFNNTWLVVVGHHALFSPGSHGDNVELQKNLQWLLEKFKVDAYFSGHDHLSAHMK